MVGPSEEETRKENMFFADVFDGLPEVLLIDEKQWAYIQRRYRLTPRELQVAKLVCQGLTNIDIAQSLKVRPGTIKTHLKGVFGKTHTRTKIRLLLRFLDDVIKFFGAAPIPIVDARKPRKKVSSSTEIPKKKR